MGWTCWPPAAIVDIRLRWVQDIDQEMGEIQRCQTRAKEKPLTAGVRAIPCVETLVTHGNDDRKGRRVRKKMNDDGHQSTFIVHLCPLPASNHCILNLYIISLIHNKSSNVYTLFTYLAWKNFDLYNRLKTGDWSTFSALEDRERSAEIYDYNFLPESV